MKNKNYRAEGFFELKAGLEGEGLSLSLEVPVRLFDDFKNCFETETGIQLLNCIYSAYVSLSDEQKKAFQESVYEFADRIIDTADLLIMLTAFKKVFV